MILDLKYCFGDKDIKEITEEDILSTLKRCSETCVVHHVTKVKTIWKKLFIIAQRKRAVQMNLVDLVESPKSDNVTERSMSEQNITEERFQAFCDAMANYGHYLPKDYKRIPKHSDICISMYLNVFDYQSFSTNFPRID